ncbi:MAG TPA: MFS transporter, partial [Idiomarina abyssalis]|nr:MFS transporter [Idiomarina abyssalis]
MAVTKPTFWQDLQVYRQSRVWVIFVLGIASGFPWVMIGSALSAWLQEVGLTRSVIGYFGAVFGAYSINFLWSPLIDNLKLPLLTRWLGQRRSWIFLCQALIA